MYKGYCEKHAVKTVGVKCLICQREETERQSESVERLVGADRVSPAMEQLASDSAAGRTPSVHTLVTAIKDAHAAIQPTLRPRTSAERKAEPIHRGCLMYFPDALAAVARLSLKANEKHNPGEPLGWTRGKSADHDDCIVRHSLTLEDIDPDTGEIEAVNRAWRALAALQLLEEKRLTAAGIMSYSKVTP